MTDLTVEEIDFLIEACRSWVHGKESGFIMAGLLTGIAMKEESDRSHEQSKLQAEADAIKASRKEQSEAMIAKLYMLRHTAVQAEIGGIRCVE